MAAHACSIVNGDAVGAGLGERVGPSVGPGVGVATVVAVMEETAGGSVVVVGMVAFVVVGLAVMVGAEVVGTGVGLEVGGGVDGGCVRSDGHTTPSLQLPWAGSRVNSPICAPQAQHGVQKNPRDSDPRACPAPQNRRCTVSASSGYRSLQNMLLDA